MHTNLFSYIAGAHGQVRRRCELSYAAVPAWIREVWVRRSVSSKRIVLSWW